MIDNKALYKISYGLYVLAVNDGDKDTGCIVNTVAMLTSDPVRVVVFVNKTNYTAEVLRRTGKFTASVLTEEEPFSTYQNFGFQSGRTADKFDGVKTGKAENGLPYLSSANAYLSGEVEAVHDYGTHLLFVAKVTESATLSSAKSVTYEKYQTSVKPAPTAKPVESKTEKWVCTVCGYEHEGPLPDDFICPWCKHPASDFEKVS